MLGTYKKNLFEGVHFHVLTPRVWERELLNTLRWFMTRKNCSLVCNSFAMLVKRNYLNWLCFCYNILYARQFRSAGTYYRPKTIFFSDTWTCVILPVFFFIRMFNRCNLQIPLNGMILKVCVLKIWTILIIDFKKFIIIKEIENSRQWN